jgi:KDO2-lipid IV(A) lauroyltransferase
LKAIIYYLTLPLIYGLASLPFWFLYRISDFAYFIIYHILGYRKKVVFDNLKNAFPEKVDEELLNIQKDFYKYLIDLAVETIKTLTISKKTVLKRVKMDDVSIFEKYHSQNQSIIIVMGHFGNWELGGARFAVEPLHKLYVIYHPLKNKYFEGLIRKMRMRLGNGLYAMKDTYREIVSHRTELTATAFIADQSASPKNAYWTKFMNQDTAVFRGTGKIAKKMNFPVVYASVVRTGRGYYNVTLEELAAEPAKLNEEEILELFTKRLEADIRSHPPIWLWSHRRWKHKRPAA